MSGIVGASLGKAKRPELIVVDVKPSDEPVYSPQVAKRLEERLKTPTDAYDIFLKHKNAEDRARECLSPLKTIEHNIKVQEVGLRAKVEDHAKRAARESDLKERHDRARQMRAQAIEDTRAKASEVSKKLVDAMHTMTVKEQVRQEELVTKITKKQLNASGTRSETLHGVKSKAATVVQKQEEAALRLKVEEEQKLLEKFNQIEEKLTAAELRRQAVQEEARGQAAKAREHHKEVQRRAGEDSAAVLAFQLHSKLASAEQKRQEVLEEVRSKASEACTPKGSGGGQPGEKLAQLEARVAAAEQRKTQVLVETQLRAAAVAKKAADVVANAKSMQETATAQAAEAIREKLDSAQKRVEEAQQARTQGLSKYMAYLNTKSSPSRESGSSPRSGGRPSIDGAALPPSMQEALAEEVALCDADEQQ